MLLCLAGVMGFIGMDSLNLKLVIMKIHTLVRTGLYMTIYCGIGTVMRLLDKVKTTSSLCV